MVEIIGVVTKIGKIKDYGHEVYFGRDWVHIFKFFIEVQSGEHGVINAMVECKAEHTDYGLRIPKNEGRQRPFIGDTVRFTTHRLQKNGAVWASVTFNQSFEITKENEEARRELQEFVAKKKLERELEYQKKTEEHKQAKKDRKIERLAELEKQKNDTILPEAVRLEITETFDMNRIINILRDTTWFVMEEGDGGKICMCTHYDGCGHPGTGMRRPNGPLYNLPESVRKSILSKAVKSGLIIQKENGYSATESGIRLLIKLDTCPECHELRTPYRATGHYSVPGQYSQQNDLGVRYMCKHHIQEIYKSQQSCNCGTTYVPFKNTEKRMARIMELRGVA